MLMSSTRVGRTSPRRRGCGRALLACASAAFIALPASAQTVINVATGSDLVSALTTAGNNPSTRYQINITQNITLTASTTVPAISTTSNVIINGGNKTLDGGGVQRGFFFYSGTASINDLIITNVKALGGAGGTGFGGGGGLGAGAALFVANGANVTVSNVNLRNSNATGGNGGNFGGASGNGGGGGGLAGNGGAGLSVGVAANNGGGGGVGLGANGGSGFGSNGAAGIILSAGPGQSGSGGSGGGGGGGKADTGGGGGVGAPSGNASGGFGGGGAGSYATDNGTGGRSFGGNGVGGFGGGGGGGAGSGSTVNGVAGGFGGGGGGADFGPSNGGGFGGGNGGTVSLAAGGGGGGAGLGGAIFVQQGGSLTIAGSLTVNGNTVTAGAGGGSGNGKGSDGSAFGSGIFLQGSGIITFSPGAGQTATVSNVIADQSGSGGTGSNAGSWNLTKTSAGTLVLSAANTYSGGTTVTGGLINFSGARNLGSGAITLDGGGLQWAAGTSTDISSRLTAFGAGGATFDTNGNNITLASTLSGTGGLTKTGSGTFTLSGANTYTGATMINAGTLIVNGSIASSSLTSVNSGGTLAGTGTVGSVQVNSGGTLAPGNSPGTITIAGNLAFQSGALYLVQIDPSTASSANVSGTATLTGASVQTVFAGGSYLIRQYTILHSGGLVGTFSGVSGNVPAGFSETLSYTATDAILNLTANLAAGVTPAGGVTPEGPSALACGFTINQCNVANAINAFFNNGGALPPNFLALFNLTGGNLANALTLLSGEPATGAQQPAFQLMNQFLGIMLDPFVDGRAGVGGGVYGGALPFAPDREPLSEDIALAYAKVLRTSHVAVAKLVSSPFPSIGAGRCLVVLKAANSSMAEFGKLDLKLRVLSGTGRIVSTMAYEAGGAARASLRGYPRIGRFLPISYDVAAVRPSASIRRARVCTPSLRYPPRRRVALPSDVY
jgi:Passenger-associated-transport-repeat